MSVVDINRIPDVNGKVPAKQETLVYEQLTISDWLAMKEKLRLELQNVTQSFVRIGYALRKIDDEKMYETDGYKSVTEFAKHEYGLEASTVSRFMAINREYSIDGYSERLRPEYIGIGQSKLSEMLQLPDKDRELITPQTQRSDIRELKDFNRSEPESGAADDIRTLIESYFRDNKKDLNDMYGMAENNHVDDGHIVSMDVKAAIEFLNPSGNKVYRKGMYMLFLYDDSVKIKKFGEDPITHTWGDFLAAVDDIFGPAAAGYHTWERYFGEEEPAADDQRENASGKAQNAEGSDQKPEKGDQKPEKGDQKPEESDQKAKENAQTAEETDISGAMNKPEEQTKGAEEKEDGRTDTAETAEGERTGAEGEELGRTGEDPGRDQSGRSGDPEMGAGGEIGRDLSAGSGDQEEAGQGEKEGDRGTDGNDKEHEKTDGQDGGLIGTDSGDEQGGEKEGTEAVAPAQKTEPAAVEEVEPKHQEGEWILVEGMIEMITVGANKVVNYRIKTKGGKIVWVTEKDIAEGIYE